MCTVSVTLREKRDAGCVGVRDLNLERRGECDLSIAQLSVTALKGRVKFPALPS